MNPARLALLFVGAMAVQWWWSSHMAVAGLAPQLLLVLTVMTAARQGAVPAMFMGFLWGLFLDLLNAHLFGANALILTLAAYGTGAARRQVDVAALAPQCLMIVVMTLAYFLLLGLLGLIFERAFLWVGWEALVFDPIYNCLLGLFLAAAWQPRREARAL